MKPIKIPFEFLPIPGYEGYYEINPFGTIRSLNRTILTKNGFSKKLEKRYMQTRVNNRGYREVRLNKNGTNKTFFVHVLVANVFHENPQKKCCVNHTLGDKLYNAYFALEFATHKENIQHAYRTGLITKSLRPVIDDCTNIEYPSIRIAAESTGIAYKTLVNYLNGNRPNPTCLKYKLTV